MTRDAQPFAGAGTRHLLLAAVSWLAASLAVAGDFPKFEYHEIGKVGNGMGQTSSVDVDGDGDLDICSKPWNGNLHVYLKNMLVEQRRRAGPPRPARLDAEREWSYLLGGSTRGPLP